LGRRVIDRDIDRLRRRFCLVAMTVSLAMHAMRVVVSAMLVTVPAADAFLDPVQHAAQESLAILVGLSIELRLPVPLGILILSPLQILNRLRQLVGYADR
jgi:hypothetical protein